MSQLNITQLLGYNLQRIWEGDVTQIPKKGRLPTPILSMQKKNTGRSPFTAWQDSLEGGSLGIASCMRIWCICAFVNILYYIHGIIYIYRDRDMFFCIYIYILYIHTCNHIYIYMYLYVYLYMYLDIYIYVYVSIRVSIYVSRYIYIYVSIRVSI